MYSYQEQRSAIFSEDGQVMFLSIRDRVKRLLKEAGAVRLGEAITGQAGDSWQMLACIDRLVELGELVELKYPHGEPAGQFRVFVGARG